MNSDYYPLIVAIVLYLIFATLISMWMVKYINIPLVVLLIIMVFLPPVWIFLAILAFFVMVTKGKIINNQVSQSSKTTEKVKRPDVKTPETYKISKRGRKGTPKWTPEPQVEKNYIINEKRMKTPGGRDFP